MNKGTDSFAGSVIFSLFVIILVLFLSQKHDFHTEFFFNGFVLCTSLIMMILVSYSVWTQFTKWLTRSLVQNTENNIQRTIKEIEDIIKDLLCNEDNLFLLYKIEEISKIVDKVKTNQVIEKWEQKSRVDIAAELKGCKLLLCDITEDRDLVLSRVKVQVKTKVESLKKKICAKAEEFSALARDNNNLVLGDTYVQITNIVNCVNSKNTYTNVGEHLDELNDYLSFVSMKLEQLVILEKAKDIVMDNAFNLTITPIKK